MLESRQDNHQHDYEEMLSQIKYAEELGFDLVWVAEHHSSPFGIIPSPHVVLAAIAQRSNKMRIGSSVSILTLNNPVHIAEDYAMVDVLSGGRLEFGVGRGYQPGDSKT
jgi:alkanesulfonate monooxygenase SsuD/methylene tetrahydromethanopterin reductase-like flavin-dependent oxidoreductase (luciferase family)